MSDYFTQQLADIRAEIAALSRERVTYRTAEVTSADTEGATFTAAVAGAGELQGLSAPPQFLPAVGDQVRITLVGARPHYEPAGIAEDAVTGREIAAGTISPEHLDFEIPGTVPDTTPPPTPSTPVVGNYLGQLKITWDGLAAGGGAMPEDLNRVDVHVSATSGFTPTAATLVSSLSTKGQAYVAAPYAATRYVRLLAYDHAGNVSPASAQASGASAQVVSADLLDGAVGTAKLADLAVVTAKIGDLAVNAAKIGSVNAGSIVSGTVTADLVMGGRFATALTGARREMNALGFQAWDASNNLLINLDGVNNLLTGRFRMALTGRRVEMGTSGSTGQILLVSPTGPTAELGSFPGVDPGTEAVRIGMQTTYSQFWNKIQVQSEGIIYSWTAYNQIVVGGDNATGPKGLRIAWATGRGNTSLNNHAIPDVTRFLIGENRQDSFFPAGGDGIIEWEVYNGTNYPRRWVRPNSMSSYFREGGSWEVIERSDDYLSVATRHQILGNGVQKFITEAAPNIGGQSYWELKPPNYERHSSLFAMLDEGGYGGSLGYARDTNSLEVLGWGGTSFINLAAASFVVSSDAATKTDIQDAAVDFLAEIRGSGKVRSYRRKQGDDRLPEPAEQIGLVAQEAPQRLVVDSGQNGLMIDLYQGWSMHHGALQQLGALLDTLTADVAALQKGVKK